MRQPSARNPGVCFTASGKSNSISNLSFVRTKPRTFSLNLNWNAITYSTSIATHPLQFVNGKFWTAGATSNIKIYSVDGENWNSVDIGQTGYDTTIAHCGGDRLAAYAYSMSNACYSTDNGLTWLPSSGYVSPAGNTIISGSNSQYVIGKYTSSIGYQYSTDYGESWQSGTGPENYFTPVWTGNMFLVAGFTSPNIYYSTTGIPGTWNSVAISPSFGGVTFIEGGRKPNTNINSSFGYQAAGIWNIDTSSGVPKMRTPLFPRTLLSAAVNIRYIKSNWLYLSDSFYQKLVVNDDRVYFVKHNINNGNVPYVVSNFVDRLVCKVGSTLYWAELPEELSIHTQETY